MSLITFEDRNYKFDKIYNFRDFGGYAGLDGRAVKTGRLFRSAHLAALSEADRAEIGEMDIQLIVDLRHAPERVKQPSRFPTPQPHVHEYPDSPERLKAKVAPHEAFLEHELYSAEDAHRYMIGSYTQRPHDKGFQTIFGDTLRFMANTPRENMSKDDMSAGVLIHCAAGKDRTGTLCALIQGLLGVSREDILADYMMTLDSIDVDKIIEPAAEMFSKRYGRTINAKSLWPMFSVAPEFLDAALKGMGDIEDYALTTLGLEVSELIRLRARYLAV